MLIKGVGSGTQTPPISGPDALQTLVLIFQGSRLGVISLSVDSVETVRETETVVSFEVS